MIEIDPERGRRDLVDHARNESENAVVADALIIEGRQHQHAAAAVADGVANEARRLGRRAGAGSGHQLFGRNSRLDQRIEQCHALGPGHRVRLARRAEYREAAGALVEQPAAEGDKPPGIGFAARREGGQNGDEHPVERLRRHLVGSSA